MYHMLRQHTKTEFRHGKKLYAKFEKVQSYVDSPRFSTVIIITNMADYLIDIKAFDTDGKRCMLLNCLAQKAGCGVYIDPNDREHIAKMGERMRKDRIEYYGSKTIKIDLSGDTFDPQLFDRDFGGPGTAARIVKELLEFIQHV